jgi:hypothetical protein
LPWQGLALVLALGACSNSAVVHHSGGAGDAGDAGATQGNGGDSAQGGGTQVTDTNIAAWPMPNDASLGLPNPASYDDTSTPGVVHDLVTNLDWLQNPGTTLYTQPDAVSFCEALSLGGIEPWRVPTFIELVSLFDVVPSQDAAPSYIAPAFQASGAYWSTSTVISNDQLLRMVDFGAAGCGTSQFCSIGVSGDPNKALGGAFCVHGSATQPSGDRFDVASDHVTDNRTGLSWLVLPAASQTGTEADAVSRCSALGSGARVPSVTELLTILTPILDPTVFRDWPSNKFAWSSSTIPAVPGSFWTGGITGASEASAGASMNRVECVR